MDDFSLILFIAVIVFAILLFGFLIHYLISIAKRTEQDKNKKDIKTEIIEDFEKSEMPVKVVDMYCASIAKGTKIPKTVNEFVVYFECEDKQVLKLSVNEEMYHGFDIGMKGILTLVDGTLYSFEIEN